MEHIYRSIAGLGHEVFKYSGQVPAEELAFWIDHIRTHGVTDGDVNAKILVYSDGERPQADRITFFGDRARAPYQPLGYLDSGILLVAEKEAK